MFLNVLTQVIILLLLILIGVILAKGKILTNSGVKSMTDMVLYTVTPCVIIKSFIREYDPSTLKKLLISFLIALFAQIGFIIFSHLILHDKDKKKERVLRYGTVFSNCGFMSIPLQQAILKDDGVFYATSYIAIFQLLVWSYGIITISGDKKYLSPKKLLLNPGIIGLSIGLIIFLCSIPIPKIISEPITYMSSLNTPLPMIIIGFHLANSSLLDGLKNLKCILAISLRLIILPLIALGVMYLLSIRGDMLVSSVISCCAPVAAITSMFSAKFNQDTSLSVNFVSLSTILSLVTMPLLITLAQYLA